MSVYRYNISGLTVASEIKLDHRVMPSEVGSDAVDVRIFVCDDVGLPENASSESEALVAAPDDFLFYPISGVSLRVINGREIRISWTTPHTEKDVLLFLFGSAWGVLCHQRKFWPLHCSAVEHKAHSFAFTGVSGAGKSTLAVGLKKRGYHHVCDDVCVVDHGGEKHEVWPVEKGIKLWNEAADFLDIEVDQKILSSYEMEKYYARESFHDSVRMPPNITLYVLEVSEDDSCHIEALSGFDRFQELYRSTYRIEWIDFLRDKDEFFQQLLMISNTINMYKFSRPRGFQYFDEGLDMLVGHFEQVAGNEEDTNAV